MANVISSADYIRILEKLVRRLRDENRRLRERASRDFLTGLYGREAWYDLLVHDILASARKENGRGPLSERMATLVYADIDRFKEVNDRYGHAAGDDVLRTVAKALTARLRATDLAARFGGDEFVIAFLDTTPGQLFAKFGGRGDGTEARIPPVKVSIGGVTVKVTMSGGAAPYRQFQPLPGESRADAVRRSINAAVADADRALYCAKQNGCNRICCLR